MNKTNQGNTRVTNGKSRRNNESKGRCNINGRPPDKSVCVVKFKKPQILNTKNLTTRNADRIDAPIVAGAAVADDPVEKRKVRRKDGKIKTKRRNAQRRDKAQRFNTDYSSA